MKGKVFCIIAARYLPYLGGVERYVYNIATEIIKNGNRVVVVTSRMNKGAIYERLEGITVYRLPSLGLLKERFPVLLYNRKTRKIVERLGNEKIDYMVVNTRFYLLSLFGVIYAKKHRIPSIVIEHGTGHFTVNNPFLDFAGHIYEHVITCLVKRECKNFYGVSLVCNEWLKHYGIVGKGVLYNAVNLEQIENFYTDGDSTEIEERIQYQKEDFVITYTGRLVKEKGVEKLLLAFREIKKHYPNVKLCIAGDGELLEEISRNRTRGVFVLGRLEFYEVVQLLKLSKVYILPTDYPEGLPTSILEAMACKVYVITTKAGGTKEIISDSSYGKIMEHNAVSEIRESLIYALENEEDRKAAAQKCFFRIKQLYTWEKTCAQLMKNFDRANQMDEKI